MSSSRRRERRVDHRDAHAVQAARDLVALAAELPAGVQHREHDLGRRLVGILGVGVDRDPAAVVDHPAAAVGQQGDVDGGRVPGQRLVDRVVHDLVDEVVEARGTGRADVHTGPLTDRLKTLENGDVLGRVRHASTPSSGLGRKPLVSVLAHPVPARERPGERGCLRYSTVYQNRSGRNAVPGPRTRAVYALFTTVRNDVTMPGPQHSAARSTSCCSA